MDLSLYRRRGSLEFQAVAVALAVEDQGVSKSA
jgi:hypothetical protein